MSELPRQRDRQPEASLLSQEAAESLQPLHEDLGELSEGYEGTVFFAKDRWHKNNASAVVTLQPDATNKERYKFYRENIAHHRVDLGATALGIGLLLPEPDFLRSRMNPKDHTTITHRTIVDDELTGGLQTAFNPKYGPVPTSTRAINQIWDKHKAAVHDVAAAFEGLSNKLADDFRDEGYASIGDVLELNPPTTPNAITVSWDLRGSTEHAEDDFAPLRNYLLDTKRLFKTQLRPFRTHFHDQGDGQDMTIWLPEITEGFDRADQREVRKFGETKILPLVERLLSLHDELVSEKYSKIHPNPHITAVISVGHVEHDIHDAYTSIAFWEAARALKNSPPDAKLLFGPRAQEIFFPSEK